MQAKTDRPRLGVFLVLILALFLNLACGLSVYSITAVEKSGKTTTAITISIEKALLEMDPQYVEAWKKIRIDMQERLETAGLEVEQFDNDLLTGLVASIEMQDLPSLNAKLSGTNLSIFQTFELKRWRGEYTLRATTSSDYIVQRAVEFTGARQDQIQGMATPLTIIFVIPGEVVESNATQVDAASGGLAWVLPWNLPGAEYELTARLTAPLLAPVISTPISTDDSNQLYTPGPNGGLDFAGTGEPGAEILLHRLVNDQRVFLARGVVGADQKWQLPNVRLAESGTYRVEPVVMVGDQYQFGEPITFQYITPDLEWLDQSPRGDTNPILLPQYGEAEAWVDFVYLGPLPAPDPKDLGLYLHKDPKGVSSPGCDTAVPEDSHNSYFGHPTWQAQTLSDGSTSLRVSTPTLAPNSTPDFPIYRFIFQLAGNGCTRQSCPDSGISRTDQNTNKDIDPDFYREDFGVYQASAGRWLTARVGDGGNPQALANAWYSIQLRPNEGSLPRPQVAIHPQSQPIGGRFALTGKGFTANGVAQMQLKPDPANEFATHKPSVFKDGTFRDTWQTSCSTTPGAYQVRALDPLTCRASDWTPLLLIDNPSCANPKPADGKPVCDVDYSLLQPGDIIVTSQGLFNTTDPVDWLETGATSGIWHHAGLYIGDNKVIHAVVSGFLDGKVEIADISQTGFYSSNYCSIYRVNADPETRQRAINYAVQQDGKPFDFNFADKRSPGAFYCSKLIWQSYDQASGGKINLDQNIGTPDWQDALMPDLVIPDDLTSTNSVTYISGGIAPDAFGATVHSPAFALLTDSQGRRVGLDPATGQLISEIPNAIFDMTSDPKYIYIIGADPGGYKLDLTGNGKGEYTLRTAKYQAGSHPLVSELSGEITAEEKHLYSVDLPSGAAAPVLTLEKKVPSPEQQRLTLLLYLGGCCCVFLVIGLAVGFLWLRRTRRILSDKPSHTPTVESVAPVPQPDPQAVRSQQDALLAQARPAFQNNELARVTSILLAARDLDENYSEPWLWLGHLHYVKHDLRTAAICYRRAEKLGHPQAGEYLKRCRQQP